MFFQVSSVTSSTASTTFPVDAIDDQANFFPPAMANIVSFFIFSKVHRLIPTAAKTGQSYRKRPPPNQFFFKDSAQMKIITGREHTAYPLDKTRASPATLPSLESWRMRRIFSMLNPSPYPLQHSRISSLPSSLRRTPTRTTSSRRENGQKIRSLPRRMRRSRAMRISQRTASPPPHSQSPPLVQIFSQSIHLV